MAPRIRDELGVPVTFDHDVAAAAYGEYTWGAGQGLPSVAYLTVGTGIGVGLVVDGSVWYGALQPEAGHIRIPGSRATPTRDPVPGTAIAGKGWPAGQPWLHVMAAILPSFRRRTRVGDGG